MQLLLFQRRSFFQTLYYSLFCLVAGVRFELTISGLWAQRIRPSYATPQLILLLSSLPKLGYYPTWKAKPNIIPTINSGSWFITFATRTRNMIIITVFPNLFTNGVYIIHFDLDNFPGLFLLLFCEDPMLQHC